jgi:hypothetical protein
MSYPLLKRWKQILIRLVFDLWYNHCFDSGERPSLWSSGGLLPCETEGRTILCLMSFPSREDSLFFYQWREGKLPLFWMRGWRVGLPLHYGDG